MDKMFQLLIVSLFFIVSTTNGLSLPPDNVDSVETTNSSLDKIEETLDVFEKMSKDKNFNASDSVDLKDSVIDKDEKFEDKLASEPSMNKTENANSTSTTTETASPSPASTPSSTSAQSSTTIVSTTVTTLKPLTTSAATSSGSSFNHTVLDSAFDSNGTVVNEIMSSMDSILHELNTNSSETSNNDVDSSLLSSGEFNNYFEELRVLDGLTALFESD